MDKEKKVIVIKTVAEFEEFLNNLSEEEFEAFIDRCIDGHYSNNNDSNNKSKNK